MHYLYSDGGRARSGYAGTVNDCATRAIAIAAQKPYIAVYCKVNELVKQSAKSKIKSSSSSGGVYYETVNELLALLGGWQYVSCHQTGTDAFLASLPKGRLILCLREHVSTLIDGVVVDQFNPFESVGNRKMIYGYYIRQ